MSDTGTDLPQKGQEKANATKFTAGFMRAFRNAPYLAPGDLVVAGVGRGEEFSGTALDDGRQSLPWGPDHERILTGLLCGSSRVRVNCAVTGEDGQPALGEDGQPQYEPREILVSDSQPLLVYLQGGDDDWFALVQDGRQRRRAALELQRRVDWCAALLAATPEARQSKPGRRNLLIKVGHAAREGRPLNEVAPGAPQYESPEVGGSLSWLTDTLAQWVVGSDSLGDSTRRGWLRITHGNDRSVTSVTAESCWVKCHCVGTNVDPTDAHFLLEGIATKQAQVDTPPSLLAEQVHRVTSARRDPGDPNSPLLYDRAAVRDRLGMTDASLRSYELLRETCDEVRALVDSGRMSLNFAVASEDSAFVVPNKARGKVNRTALPLDKQRLVLSHLLVNLKEDDRPGADDVRFRGPEAIKEGKRLRDLAIAGKLLPVGQEAAEDDVPTLPQGKPRQPQRPRPRRTEAGAIRAAFKAASERAAGAPLPDGVELAHAVGLVVCGEESLALLDRWPAVRELLAAAAPPPIAVGAATPTGPRESDLLLDWVSVAVEGMGEADVPTVTTDTDSHGRRPTEAQAAACNARIAAWVEAFKSDPSVTLLDEYLMRRVVEAQNST